MTKGAACLKLTERMHTFVKYDDGSVGAQVRHRGDRESCVKVQDQVPAVAVPGAAHEAWLRVLPVEQWQAMLAEAIRSEARVSE